MTKEEIAKIAQESGFSNKGSPLPGGLMPYMFTFSSKVVEGFTEEVIELLRDYLLGESQCQTILIEEIMEKVDALCAKHMKAMEVQNG